MFNLFKNYRVTDSDQSKLSVDSALKQMNENRSVYKEKGNFGEMALLAILQNYQDKRGGVIFHSMKYPYTTDRQGIPYPGNINRDEDTGEFYEVGNGLNSFDEIDLLYINEYRVFAIEAKARAGTWKLFDYWSTQNGTMNKKSPVSQTEKHCRHLYHTIYDLLPDGNPQYIVPMAVFVDEAKVLDDRSDVQKHYIPVAIMDLFKDRIKKYDTPLKYGLNTHMIIQRLKEVGTYAGEYR